MAQELRYTAADKKKLRAWEWQGSTATSRAVKMARPQCSVCQVGKDTKPEWWKTCDHDPYWSSQRKVRTTPVWKINEATGEEELVEETSTTRRVRVPNIVEVPLTKRANSGKGPVLFQVFKGFRYLPDIGLAPMCETHGCGKAWPSVATRGGNFCSEEHARAVLMDEEGVNTVSYATNDVSTASLNEAKNQVVI